MTSYPDVFIVGAARTPIGKFLGGLSPLKASDLGAVAIREAVSRAGIGGTEVDEVLMGHVVQGGQGQAPARQAQLKAGIDPKVGAVTINKVCGSGLKAVMMGAQAIKAGDAHCIVAGGQESMSTAPHYLFTGRTGQKLGDTTLKDGAVLDGLWCSFNDCHMIELAQYTAEKAGLKREELDVFSAQSHRKAAAAIAECRFSKEIAAVSIPQRRGEPVVISKDESVRPDTTPEALAKLSAVTRDRGGMITAGNAPGLNDGGAALVLMSGERAKQKKAKPIARVVAYATGGGEPKDLFFAPIDAVQKLMTTMGVTIDHFDLIEANEAFAAQALADGRALGWDWERVNVNGGAVALGHPIGASGARVLVTLLYALQERGKKTGLATLCLGGGNAVALAVEVV
ncbi:MAG: acetyl-CoA acetyltransferase [Candidatus Eisenbacteria bacterium RBG_16_71_46]|nr:MAG: acetyl-CoA acetyltransferase [Candidatus Eisenbacteria bacterium RBG_16_71_46]OGF23177.1 MAG: acetyl-CoA acetyltransferase [Candidatus Eisenbacteria bacterium RBG_19FT_COMBO_70_11]